MMESIPGTFADLFGFAAAVLLKATVLLTGALLLSRLLVRASAAARHAFWTVTTVALLLLPWLPAALPTVPMPWPREMSGWVAPTSDQERSRGRGGLADAPAGPFAAAASPSTSTRLGAGPLPDVGAITGAETPDVEGARRPEPRVAGSFMLLLLLWVFGSAAAAGALGLGLLRVRRLAREAQPIEAAAWRESLERARRRVGLRRRVDVRTTAAAPIPLTGGLTHPFVLIPSSADSWSVERRDLVLTHELVHVARHDALRQILSRLSSALYWFHPLAHVAARKALLAREQACDEAVVALGHRPSVYARHLLELADPARLPLPVLSLIERPQLEERVMAILRPGPRSGGAVTAAAALCASLWALTVAASAPTSSAEGTNPIVVGGPSLAAPSREREAMGIEARGALTALGMPGPSAEPTGSSAPLPRLPSQERTCWSDAAGETFVGNSFSYTQPDGSRVTERYGWVGEDRVIQTRTRETTVCMRAHGSVTLSAEGTRFGALPEGAWIVMGSREAGRTMDLVITSGTAGPEHAWYVDGARRDFGPDAMEWRDAMVPLLAAYWDVAEAGAAREALAAAESAARANRDALEQARREAELARARVLEELTSERERRARELMAANRAADSLMADQEQMLLRNRRQIEALAREIDAVQRSYAELLPARPETDSVRAALERISAGMEAIARATRDESSARAERARTQAAVSELEAQRRAQLDRIAREVEETARRRVTGDPAALERRLAEIGQQLELEIRRLQEAIRRIP